MADKILTNEEFDKIMKIINSDLTDNDKALELGDVIYFTDLRKMFDDQLRYRAMLKLFDKNSLDVILNTFSKYDSRRLFTQVKKSYKCDVKELNFRLDILNKIYSIFKSDANDLEKIEIIFNNFKDISEFKQKYTMLLKFGSNDPRLDSARDALNNFGYILDIINSLPKCEVENVVYKRELISFLEKNGYLDNYLYSEYVIETFIKSNDLDVNSFISKMKLDSDSYKYSEELISHLNPKLFNQYQGAINLKKQIYIKNSIDAIKRLNDAILTGYLDSEKEFELLDFLVHIPFKETTVNFKRNLSKFILENIENGDTVYRNICSYMHKNNIVSFSPIKEASLFSVSVFIDNQLIDNEIKKDVLRYMKSNNLPMINNVYKIMLNKYVKGDIEDLNVPLNNNDFYKNPYTLKRF